MGSCGSGGPGSTGPCAPAASPRPGAPRASSRRGRVGGREPWGTRRPPRRPGGSPYGLGRGPPKLLDSGRARTGWTLAGAGWAPPCASRVTTVGSSLGLLEGSEAQGHFFGAAWAPAGARVDAEGRPRVRRAQRSGPGGARGGPGRRRGLRGASRTRALAGVESGRATRRPRLKIPGSASPWRPRRQSLRSARPGSARVGRAQPPAVLGRGGAETWAWGAAWPPRRPPVRAAGGGGAGQLPSPARPPPEAVPADTGALCPRGASLTAAVRFPRTPARGRLTRRPDGGAGTFLRPVRPAEGP